MARTKRNRGAAQSAHFIETYKVPHEDGGFCWSLVHANGQRLITNAVQYSRRATCKTGIARLQQAGVLPKRIKVVDR